MSLAQHQHRRGPWSSHEDQQLLQLVHLHGAHNWVRISQLVGTRSPKQCRERFHQNLKPQLNHEPITPEEGELIEKLVGEMGKRWAEIARQLNGRSDNAVKNWWNGGVNRRKRMSHRHRMLENRAQEDRRRRAEEPMSPYSMMSCGQTSPSAVFSRPHHHRGEDALPSPPLSTTMSRADSKEPTPSLVSDSTSYSPRLPASPMSAGGNQLPPLHGYQGHHLGHSYGAPADYDRRASMPVFGSYSKHTLPSPETSHRYPHYHHQYQHSPQQQASVPRYYPNPPLTPTQPTASSDAGSPTSDKDRRMNISSLCS